MTALPQSDRTVLQDDELLVLIVQGDEQALGMLYDRCGGLINTIALRITGDPLCAQEVTQDVFQIVWTRAGTYSPLQGTVKAWIVAISRHRAIDELRSRQFRARRREIPTGDAFAEALSYDDDVGEQAIMAVMRTDVRSALRMLPLAQRQVIELAYYGGLTCSEMSSLLGTPLGTVKTRLRLGLVKLRATLVPGWEGVEHVNG